MRARNLLRLCTLAVACGAASAVAQQARLTNPYESVDWSTYSHFRADFHVHTIQSDGCHHLNQVVRAFREAGFSILSITDHDAVSPNQCVLGEPSPFPDPRPANFPADTTWPWNAYGAPSPTELGILGIEGAELTCTYHINSFFNDYGFAPCSSDHRPTPDDWLLEVTRRDGLAVLNHPGGSAKADGLEWITALYGNPANDRLVGMELAGGDNGSTPLCGSAARRSCRRQSGIRHFRHARAESNAIRVHGIPIGRAHRGGRQRSDANGAVLCGDGAEGHGLLAKPQPGRCATCRVRRRVSRAARDRRGPRSCQNLDRCRRL